MFAPGHEAEAKDWRRRSSRSSGDTPTAAMTADVKARAEGRPLALGLGLDDAAVRRRAASDGAAASQTSTTSPRRCPPTSRSARSSPSCPARSPCTSPSGGTCSACAPGWSASPAIRRPTSPRSEALLIEPRPSWRRSLGAEPAPARPTPAGRQPWRRPLAPRRPAAAPPLPPAQRVTSERPALERITIERAALQPHPRWRRLVAPRRPAPGPRPRWPLVAVVLGLVGDLRLRAAPGRRRGVRATDREPGAIVPGDVEVAVLNGTSVPGLAARSATTSR